MPKGRTQTWICLECKSSFQVQKTVPKLCCCCGSPEIIKARTPELAENYALKKISMERARRLYADALKIFLPVKKEYTEEAGYWKQQLKRRYITEEEYREIVGDEDELRIE